MKKPDQLSKLAGFISGLLRCETSLSGTDLRGHDRAVCDLCGALSDAAREDGDALPRVASVLSRAEQYEAGTRYAAELRAAYLALRDGMEKIAQERIAGIVSEMDATGKPLPDFLNAEDDDMGFLVNMDTGERMTWGGDLV